MSQDEIIDILKRYSSKENPLPAEEIMALLRAEGKEINEQTFYKNIRSIKEDSLKFVTKLFIRHGKGSKYKFLKRIWWIEKEADLNGSIDNTLG